MSGLLEAMTLYNLTEGLILTSYSEEKITIDHKTINIRPAWKWLLEKSFLIRN